MKKKISAIVAGIVSTVVLSTAGLSTNVFATPNKPYDSADVSISSNADSATASITRCSCNPVDNYLMAAIRVQYYDGSNYHWIQKEKIHIIFQRERMFILKVRAYQEKI